jgi:hypothetical protein
LLTIQMRWPQFVVIATNSSTLKMVEGKDRETEDVEQCLFT